MNGKSMAVLEFILAHRSEPVTAKRNLLYMQELIRQSGCFPDDFSIERLFTFCTDRANLKVPFVFQLDSPVLFPIVTAETWIKGQQPKAAVRVRARPFDGPIGPSVTAGETRKMGQDQLLFYFQLESTRMGRIRHMPDRRLHDESAAVANAEQGVGSTLNAFEYGRGTVLAGTRHHACQTRRQIKRGYSLP